MSPVCSVLCRREDVCICCCNADFEHVVWFSLFTCHPARVHSGLGPLRVSAALAPDDPRALAKARAD